MVHRGLGAHQVQGVEIEPLVSAFESAFSGAEGGQGVGDRERDPARRRWHTDGLGGDPHHLGVADHFLRQQVSLTNAPVLGGQDQGAGGVIDPDRFEFDAVQDERQLAESRAGDDGTVRGATPVAGAVGGGHAHRHRGQFALAGPVEDHPLGQHPRAHIVAQRFKVADLVGLGRDAAAATAHGGVAAGEDEAVQRVSGVHGAGDVEHVAGSLDVGAVQRRRVGQPGAGVDDAVVDVVASGHRIAQYIVVPDVAEEPFGFEVVDAGGSSVGTHNDSHVVAGVDELAGDMRAEVAVGSDDEFHARLFFCIQAAAASSRVPSSAALRHHFMPAARKRNGL